MRTTLIAATIIVGTSQLHAQLYADFTTNMGNFRVELFYKEAPRTVANFVTLAEGTRTWVDERTGLVSTVKPPQPFYNGVKFHRIINEIGFQIAQVGSKTGDGTDGPGYTFTDEMRQSVPLSYKFDQPYLLAMANAGFNTNGSQIFFTGNAIPHLEGKHTVFGRVTVDTASVDAILAEPTGQAGSDEVVIQSVTIRRVGKEAAAFRASSQRLPIVSVPKYKVAPAPSPANTNRYSFAQPKYSDFRPYVSIQQDMSTWIKVDPRWYSTSPIKNYYYDITYGSTPITGFRPVLVRYNSSDALAPSDIGGQMITMQNAEGVYVFTIPRTGAAGFTFTPAGNGTPVTGSITSGNVDMQPYRGVVSFVLSNSKNIRMTLGFDSKVKNTITGRCTSEVRDSILNSWTQPGGDAGFTMIPVK